MILYQVRSHFRSHSDDDFKVFLNIEDAEKRKKELQDEDDEDSVHEYEVGTLELCGNAAILASIISAKRNLK